jgi:hypothetical protein
VGRSRSLPSLARPNVVTDLRTIRVDTHRVVMVLYGLCGSARAGLIFEPHPEAPGAVVASFAGRNGGRGQVSIPDDPALRATLDWLAREAKAEVYLRAVLAAVRACDGIAGEWAYERVLELLWGSRKHRQSRGRKVPPVRRIIKLLCEASWLLDAPVSTQPAPPKGRSRDKGRYGRRAGYGGTFRGCLLDVDTKTRTVHLNAELRSLLDTGPYDQRPAELFRLPQPGHRNPRGRIPSRADCWLMRQGAWDYARFRQAEALRRGGAVQAIRVEDLLGRWTSINVDSIRRRRLLPAVVDRLESELVGATQVGLAGPIDRHRQAGRCEVRLHLSSDRRPRSPTGPTSPPRPRDGIHHGWSDDRRPTAASTSTGRPTSTGPPHP